MDISTVTSSRLVKISVVGAIAVGGGLAIWYGLNKRRKPVVISKEDNQLTMDFDRPEPVIFEENLPERIVKQDQEKTTVIMTDSTYSEVLDEDSTIFENGNPINIDSTDTEDGLSEVTDELVNVFSGPEWDYEKENVIRENSQVYVLHQDEFFRDSKGFPQSILTWYDGDEVLVDESDQPIYNPRSVVGDLPFGHGSNDRDVVYVRNEIFETEYEILRHSGSFSEEILGLDSEHALAKEIEHSSRVQRFRASD